MTPEVLQRLLDDLLLLHDLVPVDERVVDEVADDGGEDHALDHRPERTRIHLGSLGPDHVCESRPVRGGIDCRSEERGHGHGS